MGETKKPNIDYPLDPRDLQQIYVNHVAVFSNERECVIDLGQVQPHTMDSGPTVLMRARLILSPGFAQEFAELIRNAVSRLPPPQKKD